ncbi:MAG TPA: SAM-dependent methyltransferase [Nitrospiraceae bacterium]|nr:SAM-dependent methyltransferase [Nitrospiraceae bacterium]
MMYHVNIGHPNLVAEIAEEILRSGPITFARFMELALYHPQFGYYMCQTEGVNEERIGWSGDYYTSADVHPALAQALVRQIRQVDELLGRPDPLTVIEMGAGKGLLAHDFLAACAKGTDSLYHRLRYVLIERSPAMRATQKCNLAPLLKSPGPVSWVNDLEELPIGGVNGAVLSNELVDAFPVHRIRIERGEPKEVFVEYRDGQFEERLQVLSTQNLSEYLRRLASLGVTLSDGYTTEINLHALAWMKDVARTLGRGLVITIDYGHTAQDLYGPERHRGTLLCYHSQMASDSPYTLVGLQDMTAHVDFTSLAIAGEEVGLHVTGFTNQMSFLMGLGVEQVLDSLEPGSAEFQSIVQLLRPDGMGRTFKILIQHKGLDHPELDGLRFKPFFGSVLSQVGDTGHEAMGQSIPSSPSPSCL